MPASMSIASYEAASWPARLLAAANRHPGVLTWTACALAALPAASLGWRMYNTDLGPNPLDSILRVPGRWALILLLVVLSATPLRHALAFAARRLNLRFGRRLADWNWMIRMRRALGLASFFYAVAHVTVYLTLDVGFAASELLKDLRTKPFILAGLGAFLLLVPLAVTSTDAWMHRLKRGWKRLHLLVYPAAVLAVLHFMWLSKPGVTEPLFFALVLGVLLLYRLLARRFRAGEPPDTVAEEIAPLPVASERRSASGRTPDS
jgi:methionine sulfoxide reductase heme-binding subunit